MQVTVRQTANRNVLTLVLRHVQGKCIICQSRSTGS